MMRRAREQEERWEMESRAEAAADETWHQRRTAYAIKNRFFTL